MDDSAITCDEIIESYEEDVDAEVKSNNKAKSYDETKTIPTNFNEKKATCKAQNFYILLAFLLITMTLLISVSIHFYVTVSIKQNKKIHYRFTSKIAN